jgi:hypothetical protein
VFIRLAWSNLLAIGPARFVCYCCGSTVGGREGYFATTTDIQNLQARIYICPFCTRPTLLVGATDRGDNGIFEVRVQEPGASYGPDVENLSDDVKGIYGEARRCLTVEANAAAVMLCRKLLMHIAVERGAQAGESFVFYIDYLLANGFISANNRDWVDRIRTLGNEANHTITAHSRGDAETIIEFSAMLLKTIYEYPARAQKP